MEAIYYVYVYLDTRKPGSFLYGEYVFDFEPFYVGQGHNNRKFDHLKEANNIKKNSYKLNIIRKILSNNLIPKIITYKENLYENDSKILEIKMIASIGRNNLGNGPLTNLTDGGDGHSGYIASDELKKKLSEIHSGVGNGMYNKKHSSKTREQISKVRKEKIKNGEIVPMKHTEEWKQELRDKYAINNNLILKLHDEGKSILEINQIIPNITKKTIRQKLNLYSLIPNNNYNKKIILNIDKVHEFVLLGLSYKEIAEQLNVSESTISKNYRKSKYYTGLRSKWDIKKIKLSNENK